jgi:ankyrin repeat protein
MHGHLAIVQSVLKALQQQQQQLQHSSHSPLSSPVSSPSSKLAAARRSRDSTTPPVSPRGTSNAQQQQPGALQQQQQQHVVALSPKASGAVADVDARNSNGDTPLMFAASSGHMGIVAALLNVSCCWCRAYDMRCR